jgi:hypothetical protein
MGRNLQGIAVFCGLVIFLSGKPSFAQEMVPIQKYIDQNGSERNPDAANFLFLRCATILLLVGSLLQNDQDQSLHATGKQYWESGQQFLKTVERSQRFSEKLAVDEMKRVTEGYKEHWLRSNSGSEKFSDDPLIQSDIRACAVLRSKLLS